MKRGYLQISFAWLFSIIVGVFILILAIYGVTKIIKTGEEATSAKTGKEIGVLLNPLETSFEEQVILLTIPKETRIRNTCGNLGDFGTQSIQLSQKSFKKWSETDVDTDFSNKYIFSESIVEGKNFFLFSKRFEFPFKVADLIYLTSSKKEYCFLDAPEEIANELLNLNQENLFIEDCPEGSIDVCWDGDCDIAVNENLKSVEKRGEIVYYETDALMYAAIFSDREIYECQVNRLMQRVEELAIIYNDKASIISDAGCLPEVNLLTLASISRSVDSSNELMLAETIVENAEAENNRAECRLW